MKAKHRPTDWIEAAKKRAAMEAVKHVRNDYVIGLGSGSTASYATQEIGKIIRQKTWHVLGVPTSYQAFLLGVDCGIPITTLNEHPKLDLTIDGADQVDHHLNVIKGAGGALTKEKIVALASERTVIVADETKLVEKLGTNTRVPVEVMPFAASVVMSKIRDELGGKPVLRIGSGKVGPVITDNGNFLLDVDFGSISAPKELNSQLKSITGVIESGLFIDIANIMYLGTAKGVQKLDRN